jgi:uncharacterized protein (UPF0332 family)
VKDLEQARIRQAEESLDGALALLEGGMDAGSAVTSVFYAFYYPVLALVNEGRVPYTMQHIVIGLFDRQFIATGIFHPRYSEALHRVFSLRPACGSEAPMVTSDEIKGLVSRAGEFINAAAAYLMTRS